MYTLGELSPEYRGTGGHKMDNRIRTMRESVVEHEGSKGYFFYFENVNRQTIASVIWYVHPMTDTQSLALNIGNVETEQVRGLLITYYSARKFAERFDLDAIMFLFDQYANNENIEIICE